MTKTKQNCKNPNLADSSYSIGVWWSQDDKTWVMLNGAVVHCCVFLLLKYVIKVCTGLFGFWS